MWKLIFTFGAGLVVGALGATYMAGIEQGHREAQRAVHCDDEAEEANNAHAYHIPYLGTLAIPLSMHFSKRFPDFI